MGEEDDDEDKRVGGWTGIADELAADKDTGEVTLVSGVLVEPKKVSELGSHDRARQTMDCRGLILQLVPRLGNRDYV